LFNDDNSWTNDDIVSDGMCVAQLYGHDYKIGQNIKIRSIGKIITVYCGHPSVVDSSRQYWSYSHGECDEPEFPDSKKCQLSQ
jgi:hypothetical protein